MNKTSTTLIIDGSAYGTEQLTATVYPSSTCTWTSSNPSVATVSNTGLVTSVANGTTTIKVTTEDGLYTASCTVRVRTRRTVTLDINNTFFGNNVTSRNYTTTYGQTINVSFSAIQNRDANYIEIARYATMTVSGVEMTQITVTFSDNNHALVDSTDPGTWSSPNWTGSSNSVEFVGSRAGGTGNRRYCRFKQLTITYWED